MENVSLCRTCLSQNSLNPIYTDSTDYLEYSNAIFITTGLKIEAHDGLPQKMCTDCVTFLNNYLKFRKKCKESETTLINIKKQMELKKNSLKPVKSVIIEFSLKNEFKTENIDDSLDTDDDKPLKHFLDHSSLLQDIDSDNDTTDNILKKWDKVKKEEEEHLFNNPHVTECKDNLDVDRTDIIECDDKRIELKREMKMPGPLHKVSKSNKKRVVCKICQKELSIRSIDSHMARCHPGADDNREKCELCDNFVTKAKMNRHMVLMHGSGTFKCGYCKSEHGSRESLVEHVVTCAKKKKKRKPSDTSRELQECDVCRKIMQKASLRTHKMIKHAGLGPVCEHCGLRFGNKFRLNEHYRAKHGYEKFKCTYCDFQSAGVMAMRNHERRHRGEKPFVCETCGAKFHAGYLLSQHKHSHRTEKLVKCELCPATFKSNNSLHKHKLTCHNASLYRCGVCERAFRCRHYAVKHLRLVHRYKGPAPPITREEGCQESGQY